MYLLFSPKLCHFVRNERFLVKKWSYPPNCFLLFPERHHQQALYWGGLQHKHMSSQQPDMANRKRHTTEHVPRNSSDPRHLTAALRELRQQAHRTPHTQQGGGGADQPSWVGVHTPGCVTYGSPEVRGVARGGGGRLRRGGSAPGGFQTWGVNSSHLGGEKLGCGGGRREEIRQRIHPK